MSKPDTPINLHNGESRFLMNFCSLDMMPIGILYEDDYGHLHFTGDAQHSANIFFRFLTALWDNRVEMRRQTEAAMVKVDEAIDRLKH